MLRKQRTAHYVTVSDQMQHYRSYDSPHPVNTFFGLETYSCSLISSSIRTEDNTPRLHRNHIHLWMIFYNWNISSQGCVIFRHLRNTTGRANPPETW